MIKIRIGTRGSKLALRQAALVQAALRGTDGRLETEIVVVHTKGDRIQNKPLSEIGEKGVFASELEKALRDGEIDIAVHSAKDLPMALAEGLCIAAVLPRGDVRDVLVIPKGGRFPLSAGSGWRDKDLSDDGMKTEERDGGIFVIGSGSRRRQWQAGRMWENVVCENIRGNVDTRLQKLINRDGGKVYCDKPLYDGIILAKAGLDRLDIISGYGGQFDFYPLSPEKFLPAACQGMIAVETIQDSDAAGLCREMTDGETELCFWVEREVLSALSADCSEAIAAWCRREDGRLVLDVMYAGNRGRYDCTADSDLAVCMKEDVLLQAGLAMARQAAEQMKEKGGA